MEVINAIGRRKAAIARVFVKEGKGDITINGRELANYFPSSMLQFVVNQPLNTVNALGKYDIKVNLKGGQVAVEGTSMDLKSSSNLNIKATANLSAEATGMAKVKGSLLNLN